MFLEHTVVVTYSDSFRDSLSSTYKMSQYLVQVIRGVGMQGQERGVENVDVCLTVISFAPIRKVWPFLHLFHETHKHLEALC